MLGFMEPEAEPEHFLSIDDIKLNQSDDPDFSGFSIQITNNRNVYKRTAYSLLGVLGDFGGFNDAIVFLISLFMSSYSAKMYAA